MAEAAWASCTRRARGPRSAGGTEDDPGRQPGRSRGPGRFSAEAQSVARLQHPNIVQIHEIGEWQAPEGGSPLPFFSLEFVEGGTLADKIHKAPMTARQSAEMVQTLALAAQAAHEHGIVHRDLKPANVLLTAGGVPKITDFGLAKRLDEATRTQTGPVMGTPSYMSPEQARGKTKLIGPATNVYSLGAILYEMLTSRRPFKAATPAETIMQVLYVEPVSPARLQPLVPRDLETICLHCLDKEPAKRYPSAAELASDLRRFLNGEPILARPVRLWERAAKSGSTPPRGRLAGCSDCTRHHPGVCHCQWKWREAESARVRADEQRQLADAHYHLVRDAVDEFTQLGEKRLVYEPHMESIRRDMCCVQRLRFINDSCTRGAPTRSCCGKPDVAQCRVGDIQQMLGEHAAAEDAYLAAENLLSELVDRFPENHEYIHDLATCYVDHGELLKNLGHLDEAERTCHVALQQQDKVPARPGYRQERCLPRTSWASSCTNAIAFGEADEAFRPALQVLEELTARAPGQSPYHEELARCLSNRGATLHAMGREQDAESSYTKGATTLLGPLQKLI